MDIRKLGEKISRDMGANNCGGIFVITDLEVGGHLCGGNIPADFEFIVDQLSALVFDLSKKFNIPQEKILAELTEQVELRKKLTETPPQTGRKLH